MLTKIQNFMATRNVALFGCGLLLLFIACFCSPDTCFTQGFLSVPSWIILGCGSIGFDINLLRDVHLFLDIIGFLREGLAGLREFDWLRLFLLFVPFNIAYVMTQEKYLKLKRNVQHLEGDNEVKTNFIKWQGKVNLELQEALAELRVEKKSMVCLLDNMRRQTLVERGDLGLPFKRNKSDSALDERTDEGTTLNEKPRPKTEEGKPVSASKGRTEKTREVVRSRLYNIKKERDGSMADDTFPKRTNRNRSRFTLQKELEQFKLPPPRCKSTTEAEKRKEVMGKQHCIIPKSRSDSGKLREELTRSVMSMPKGKFSEEFEAKLELKGLGRATSYTEVFKKKVQVQSNGRAPEITIEGKQRWCF